MNVTEKEIIALVQENEHRHEEIFGTYDPCTGEGCYDFEHRVKMEIPDFFIPVMYVPKEAADNFLYQNLIRHGSIEKFITDCWQKEYTQRLAQMVALEICKVRFREDPEFALYITDKIEDKATGQMIPFRLNYPQRRLLKLFEDLRHQGKPIRVIILKARQWGGSTLTQLYIKWMQDFRHDGWNSIVLSQVKGTSKKIKAMYRKAIESQPGWTIGLPNSELKMAPYENSVDDFIVSDGMRNIRRSTLTVASFDNFDNVRGSNFHCAHYSEVAYWKHTEEHDPEAVISSISGGIDPIADNIEVFESTGRGASGFFYERCQMAMDKKNNDAYSFIFIPFYIIEKDMLEVEDPYEFAEWLLKNRNRSTCPDGWREEGKFFWRMWKLGASFEAINWYRTERNKYKTHAYMATEAPVDETEAFRNSGNLVFSPYSIDELMEEYKRPPAYYADIVIPADIRKSKRLITDSKVEIREGNEGEMKIWSVPNNHILKIANRYVVCVDIGGKSTSADYTVMTVIDRMGMMPSMKGVPRVVARWRSHCRHDILAWKAAALAHYYDDALLVIESNSIDRTRDNNVEGDHFGTIIEEISDFYPNLYMRSAGPEAVQDKPTMKYGFHTNTLTKSWIIDNLIAFVDDKLWDEPDAEMYRELRNYERRDDGTMGNIQGKDNHDDVLMSTAIALWVCMNDMKKPEWKRIERQSSHISQEVTEATI